MEPAPWERDDDMLTEPYVSVVELPQWSPLLGSGMTPMALAGLATSGTCRNGARSLGSG